MERLILSVAIYLAIADILGLQSAIANPKVTPVTHENKPVTVGGFFDDIQKGVEDLNNTIRGVRSTVNEFNQLQDEINGKNTQNSPNNQNNTTNSIPDTDKKSSLEQQPQPEYSPPNYPESSPSEIK
jgi:Sec-independent protein translocase protein TatA